MNRKLLTIGYEGRELGPFIAALQANSVECLIDIREIPISRKRGFSKSALCEALEEAGIGYKHFPRLGSPKALRHAVRDDKDYTKFFRGVEKHLKLPPAQEQLREAVAIARFRFSCMMCFCGDWERCHRRVVAEAICSRSHFAFGHLETIHQNRSRLVA